MTNEAIVETKWLQRGSADYIDAFCEDDGRQPIEITIFEQSRGFATYLTKKRRAGVQI